MLEVVEVLWRRYHEFISDFDWVQNHSSFFIYLYPPLLHCVLNIFVHSCSQWHENKTGYRFVLCNMSPKPTKNTQKSQAFSIDQDSALSMAEILHQLIDTWNPKQPFINGCFNWMIPNLYIENGCFTKHPFINGCLGFQVVIPLFTRVLYYPSQVVVSLGFLNHQQYHQWSSKTPCDSPAEWAFFGAKWVGFWADDLGATSAPGTAVSTSLGHFATWIMIPNVMIWRWFDTPVN